MMSHQNDEEHMDERQLNLKPFTQRRMRGETSPYLSIQRRGGATLNRASAQALGNPEAVSLFFDEDHQVLGLRASTMAEKHAYALRKTSGRGETYVLSLAALLRYFNVDLERARGRYQGAMYKDMLIFDLTQGATSGEDNA